MSNKQRSFWSTPKGWAALGLIGAASYFLLIEHTQHLFQFLPFLLMLGFLLQWPTIPTLLMFPILVVVYVRLANKEEQMVISEFGDEYLSYMSIPPAWIPKFNLKKSYKKQGENYE
ncbi:MAG: DUF2933 domain-containing protein [Colwellia sp.]|nr:DUF2933 domain-containing protein [Colwellia sp.]